MTLKVGITGNIGSGKSTVRGMMEESPQVVGFDCDRVAKEILEDQSHRGSITEILGSAVLGQCGEIKRKKVAEIIFSQEKKRKQLESFIVPRVLETIGGRIREQGPQVAIIESATLYEQNAQSFCDIVVCVVAPVTMRHERLVKKRGFTYEEAAARERLQIPQSIKESMATYTIDSACTQWELKKRVRKLFEVLQERVVT